jgi:hypothetical protein
MYKFSFIDFGLKDFLRDDEGKVVVEEFSSYQEADDFIADGKLEWYGWTNSGTRKWCWDEEEYGVDVP